MTPTRAVERRIVQHILTRERHLPAPPPAVRLIASLAAGCAGLVLLACLPAVPWIALSLALVVCLGLR